MLYTCLLTFCLTGDAIGDAGSVEPSPSNSLRYVQIAVEAAKTDAFGLQTLTVRLKIQPNQRIFAHAQQLDGMVPSLKLQAATRDPNTKVDVIYPKGRNIGDRTLPLYANEGEIAIQVLVRRAKGDRSPLEGRVEFRAVGTVF